MQVRMMGRLSIPVEVRWVMMPVACPCANIASLVPGIPEYQYPLREASCLVTSALLLHLKAFGAGVGEELYGGCIPLCFFFSSMESHGH